MINFRPGSVTELVFGYSSGTKHLGRFVEGTYTADDMATDGTGGVAISSRWQSGWFNYGQPIVKTIRESHISGTGLVTVNLYRDYRQLPSQSKEIELSPTAFLWDGGTLWDSGAFWGPATIVQAKPFRKAIRGEVFSLGFSNNVKDRTYKVHRFTTYLREVRVPSVVKVR